jgi:hypothetical protein
MMNYIVNEIATLELNYGPQLDIAGRNAGIRGRSRTLNRDEAGGMTLHPAAFIPARLANVEDTIAAVLLLMVGLILELDLNGLC